MESFNEIDWEMILTEIILPNFSTILIYVVSFCTIGLILGLIYIMVLRKKQIFVRQQKYYNWIVKLYIPLLIIVFLYFSFNFALIYSAKKIVRKEEPKIVSEIYDVAVDQIFDSPASREEFIKQAQVLSIGYKKKSEAFSDSTIEVVSQTVFDLSLTNTDNKKITNYFIKKYQIKLYDAILYGLNIAAGSPIKSKEMSLKDVNKLVNVLNTLEPAKIETSVKTKLTEMVDKIIASQINGFAKTTLLIFLLLIFIPVLEWFIYNWYMKRKLKTVQSFKE